MATALALSATGARIALDPVWGYQHNRHLLFLPVVMLSAWLGGFGPGVLATTICTLALDYFWTQPRLTLLAHGLGGDLLLFFVISLAVCALVESLRLARVRADAATAAREQMLAIVAHDLRNPLGTIKLAVAAFQRARDDDPPSLEAIRRRLGAVDRAVLRMEQLIRDLVDVTHVEHGDLPVSLQPEAVAPLVREVSDTFGPLARHKGVSLECAPAPEATIQGDRHRLIQVLGNLIGNALRFTPSGGAVRVRATERADAVLFEVEDTGPGISPEHLPHIFDRYWKAGSEGNGLGLFIARSIVVAHGSELAVATGPGRGTTFSFSIARERTARPEEPAPKPSAPGVPRP